MRVLIVTGSYPPDLCGVGAYTRNLVQNLINAGIQVDVTWHGPWRGFAALRNIFQISKSDAEIIHIQYPTVGFGRGLATQVLSLLSSKIVVTVHEVSQVHPLRRLALLPFTLRARHLLFTNEFERQYSIRLAPWIQKKSSVIPLGSSISVGDLSEKSENRVIHFGLIRPNKGIEDVIEAARLSQSIRFLIVGTPDANTKAYYESLRNKSEGLPIDWLTDLSDAQVSAVLSHSRFAYMPFPDGATERRTSLLALYANGNVVLTTSSNMTPEGMKSASVIVRDPQEAVSTLETLMNEPEKESRIRDAALKYLKQFSWPAIAASHAAIYRSVKRS